MRWCIVAALLVGVLSPLVVIAGQEYGGIVRIHFDESPVPDLSVIRDIYAGAAFTICAHVVIDSVPQGVSGYHVAYEIVSEDSSVDVLPGFHPGQGWTMLDGATDLAIAGGQRIAGTPVSVGYWRLLLRKGGASHAIVRLRPITNGETSRIVLIDGLGREIACRTVYHGGLNISPPSPDHFGGTGSPADEGWSTVPEVHPVWILKVEDGRVHVALNEFVSLSESLGSPRQLPVDIVPVLKRTGLGMVTTKFVEVRDDGSLTDRQVVWDPQRMVGAGRVVGASTEGKLAVVSIGGTTQLREPNGRVISDLRYDVAYAMCNDVGERILAVSRQESPSGVRRPNLWKLSVLDYGGSVLYEGPWTDCEYNNPRLSSSGEVVTYRIDDCSQSGLYVLRLSEGIAHRLGPIAGPRAVFSPDGRLVVAITAGGSDVYRDSLSLCDISVPELPAFLWGRRFTGRVHDVAVSDPPGFLFYALAYERREYREVFAVSARTGEPIARLVAGRDTPVTAPFVIVGGYLFTGCWFETWDGVSTTNISVFDLSALPRAR